MRGSVLIIVTRGLAADIAHRALSTPIAASPATPFDRCRRLQFLPSTSRNNAGSTDRSGPRQVACGRRRCRRLAGRRGIVNFARLPFRPVPSPARPDCATRTGIRLASVDATHGGVARRATTRADGHRSQRHGRRPLNCTCNRRSIWRPHALMWSAELSPVLALDQFVPERHPRR